MQNEYEWDRYKLTIYILNSTFVSVPNNIKAHFLLQDKVTSVDQNRGMCIYLFQHSYYTCNYNISARYIQIN